MKRFYYTKTVGGQQTAARESDEHVQLFMNVRSLDQTRDVDTTAMVLDRATGVTIAYKTVNPRGTHGGYCSEHYQPPVVWFEAQTGIIYQMLPEAPSNFKRYRVLWTRIPELEYQVECSSIGSGGIAYVNTAAFLKRLDEFEAEARSYETVLRDKAFENAITQAEARS